MVVALQTLYNPRTREVRAIDISGGTAEVMALYRQGWRTYSATPAQTKAIVSRAQIRQREIQKRLTAPVQARQQLTRPTPLTQYVSDGMIDLVAVAKSGDQAAISEANFIYGDKMSTAVLASKKPVTMDTYLKLTDRVQEDVRLVSPVSLEKWNSLSDEKKLRHYPESRQVGAGTASKLGPAVLGRTAQYAPSVWEQLTPWAEEKGETASPQRNLLWLAEVVVPGVQTEKYWDKMSIPEKVGSVALDLLIVGSFARAIGSAVRGGAAALRPRFRTPAEVKAAISTSVDAGKAHARLQEATKALVTHERLKFKVPGGLSESQLRHEVQLAANQSMKADTRFLRQISGVQGLTSRDLGKIQKLSKLPGIRNAINDVGKFQNQLKGMWKSLARWEKKMGYAPGKSRVVDIVYSHKLTDIQAVRNKLDRALVRFGEVARPRVRHTPAPEFKGYEMKWAEAYSGREGLKPVMDDYTRLLKDSARHLDLQRIADRVRIKETALFTLEKKAPKTGVHTLSLKEVHAEAKAASLEIAVPTLKAGRVRTVKMQLSEVAKIARMTPAMVAKATPDVIAQFYALKVISSVMAQPVTEINTKAELKTAAQINAQYQTALAYGLKAAAMASTETRAMTAVEARAAIQAAVQAATQVSTAAQVQTKVAVAVSAAVKTQVRQAVKAILRARFPLPRGAGPGPELKIEKVEGVKGSPGVIQFHSGIVKVTVSPPYRQGVKDITYTKLKVPETGKGSQEATLRVVGGSAPAKVVLSRGIDEVVISDGKKMTHSRRSGSAAIRGPGILVKGGKVKRQRRGSII